MSPRSLTLTPRNLTSFLNAYIVYTFWTSILKRDDVFSEFRTGIIPNQSHELPRDPLVGNHQIFLDTDFRQVVCKDQMNSNLSVWRCICNLFSLDHWNVEYRAYTSSWYLQQKKAESVLETPSWFIISGNGCSKKGFIRWIPIFHEKKGRATTYSSHTLDHEAASLPAEMKSRAAAPLLAPNAAPRHVNTINLDSD